MDTDILCVLEPLISYKIYLARRAMNVIDDTDTPRVSKFLRSFHDSQQSMSNVAWLTHVGANGKGGVYSTRVDVWITK